MRCGANGGVDSVSGRLPGYSQGLMVERASCMTSTGDRVWVSSGSVDEAGLELQMHRLHGICRTAADYRAYTRPTARYSDQNES